MKIFSVNLATVFFGLQMKMQIINGSMDTKQEIQSLKNKIDFFPREVRFIIAKKMLEEGKKKLQEISLNNIKIKNWKIVNELPHEFREKSCCRYDYHMVRYNQVLAIYIKVKEFLKPSFKNLEENRKLNVFFKNFELELDYYKAEYLDLKRHMTYNYKIAINLKNFSIKFVKIAEFYLSYTLHLILKNPYYDLIVGPPEILKLETSGKHFKHFCAFSDFHLYAAKLYKNIIIANYGVINKSIILGEFEKSVSNYILKTRFNSFEEFLINVFSENSELQNILSLIKNILILQIPVEKNRDLVYTLSKIFKKNNHDFFLKSLKQNSNKRNVSEADLHEIFSVKRKKHELTATFYNQVDNKAALNLSNEFTKTKFKLNSNFGVEENEIVKIIIELKNAITNLIRIEFKKQNIVNDVTFDYTWKKETGNFIKNILISYEDILF